MLEKRFALEKGVKGRKGCTGPLPVTPIEAVSHKHKWEKQPDLCLYERHKAAFWITLMCTTCGRLDGYHLLKKDLPLRANPTPKAEVKVVAMRHF